MSDDPKLGRNAAPLTNEQAKAHAKAVFIAVRCALRLVPVIVRIARTRHFQASNESGLSFFRVFISIGVFQRYPSEATKRTLKRAIDSMGSRFLRYSATASDVDLDDSVTLRVIGNMFRATRGAVDAVLAEGTDPVDYMIVADSVADAFAFTEWNAPQHARSSHEGSAIGDPSIYYLNDQLQSDEDLARWHAGDQEVPLWTVSTADHLDDRREIEMRTEWAKNPEIWAFWLRWWDGVLNGRQIDWELQKAVAMIPEEIWELGPAAVAELIAEIELDRAIARTPNAEIIQINPETGLFQAVPDSRLPVDHLSDVILKIGDAADTFGGLEQTDNRYTAVRPDIEYLRTRAARDRDNPRALYDLCRSVARRIEARVKDQALPSGDPLVQDCVRQLNEAAIDIAGFDEKTREVVKNRTVVNLNRLDMQRAPDLVGGAEQVARLVEGVLVNDIPSDARLIMDLAATAEERAAAVYSQLSRFARIVSWYRKLGTKEQVLVATAGLVAAAGGINTLFELFDNLWPLVQWLMAAL